MLIVRDWPAVGFPIKRDAAYAFARPVARNDATRRGCTLCGQYACSEVSFSGIQVPWGTCMPVVASPDDPCGVNGRRYRFTRTPSTFNLFIPLYPRVGYQRGQVCFFADMEADVLESPEPTYVRWEEWAADGAGNCAPPPLHTRYIVYLAYSHIIRPSGSSFEHTLIAGLPGRLLFFVGRGIRTACSYAGSISNAFTSGMLGQFVDYSSQGIPAAGVVCGAGGYGVATLVT